MDLILADQMGDRCDGVPDEERIVVDAETDNYVQVCFFPLQNICLENRGANRIMWAVFGFDAFREADLTFFGHRPTLQITQ